MSEHEALRLGLSQKLARLLDEADWAAPETYSNAADAAISFIAEQTKDATGVMLDERTNCEEYVARNTWTAMHAVSALWPAPEAPESRSRDGAQDGTEEEKL